MTRLVATFEAAALERGCRVLHAASQQDAAAIVREICAGRPTLVDAIDLLTGVDLGSTPPDPWAAEVGVAAAWAAAAETGTVALVKAPGAPRQTSILPLVSVILVDTSRIFASYAELIEAVGALQPRPSNVQLVTGASRSGDVQGIIVRGMHGPAEVVLVLHPQAPSNVG